MTGFREVVTEIFRGTLRKPHPAPAVESIFLAFAELIRETMSLTLKEA